MGLKILSQQFRDEILKLNLKTPPDIVTGLVNLSGSALYTSYIDSLGKDAVIKTDKASVTLKDPGNVFTDSIAPRNSILNRNLTKPDNTNEIVLNNFRVLDPGDIVNDSIAPRNSVLNRNLPKPPNSNIGDDTIIGNRVVVSSDDVDVIGNIERQRLFNKNRPLNISDPSENDELFSFLSQGGYTYTSLLQSIGKLALINDLNIPNAISVSARSNQPPEVTLQLQLQQNRYLPVEFSQFEPTILSLKPDAFSTPYIDAYKSGVFTYNAPQQYAPSSFLDIPTAPRTSSLLTNSDPLAFLLNGGNQPLKDETLLMNIAALELKFNFQSRINMAIERETLGRVNVFNALTNPIAAGNIVRDPFGWFNLFERNYGISTSPTSLGRAAEFTASLAGVTNPLAIDFAFSIDDDLAPRCFGDNVESNRQRVKNRDAYFLRRTGTGQKYSLFFNTSRNKYQPDYLSDDEIKSSLNPLELRGIRRIGGYFGVGEKKDNTHYIGSRNSNPINLLQDSDGFQVKSNEKLTDSIKNQGGVIYDEPGYSGNDGVSKYGSQITNFIWRSDTANETAFDFTNNLKSQPVKQPLDRSDSILSTNKLFRDCSILDVTNRLASKGINGYSSPIDQTLTKFYDGYNFVSRGNSTIAPKKIQRLNKEGEVIGYRYVVPGLDSKGERKDSELYNEAEMCRVFTKTRPYSKITDLVRYKELNRKERNSVIDRFGNYNIFPSELNVNKGYGRLGNLLGDAAVESFGVRRARKYMFSIENLAWRDAWDDKGKMGLPDCEKGPNGGRIMWFPPYDIQFTDNNSANWTTHQFLGRPEPIYTYNNTERTGTLSWKIVVDHPSVLNILTKKELKRLTDGEVDELLSAFWAGCLEFDVFELARIWNQFSISDIEYFKKVIGNLDISKNNAVIKPKVEQSATNRQPGVERAIDINKEKPISRINGYNLFFENDVPLRPEIFKENKSQIYDTGIIQPFDVLMKQYYTISNSNTDPNSIGNVEFVKNEYKNKSFDPSVIRYQFTLGDKSQDNYMNNKQIDPKWYGMFTQYEEIGKDLSDTKYIGFNLKIKVKAFSSPLGPNASPSNYNVDLSRRRFISVIKWLVDKVMNKPNLGKMYFDDDSEVTTELLTNRMREAYINKSTTITFKRSNNKPNNGKDEIVFELLEATAQTPIEAIREVIKEPNTIGPENKPFYEVFAPEPNNDTPVRYCCFETDAIAKKVISDKLFDTLPDNRIGSIEPKPNPEYQDIVCGLLSIVPSYSRRVTLNVEVTSVSDVKKGTEVIDNVEFITSSSEKPLTEQNVTKRDIAQRIINKMITECDYFELLNNEAPFLYKSLKEKLKYFQPSFHAMTPEGLNARLTFLQQCLRPGETIRRSDGEDTCDASNTSFGKPPICVLRVGDFYNTKIAIDSLNISYDPLVWDLNPEGIGAQPMIANIQMGFKYIGGSGLRKYVDELQNALSFNYYANTDIYDDRTFANKDEFERNLINLETSFFDGDTLDLIPIVSAAERIVPQNIQQDIPYGTIGNVTKRLEPTPPGGAYSIDILNNVDTFNSSEVYQPFSVVSSQNKFYLRKADNEANLTQPNTLDGISAPITNTKYWNEIVWRNYGEQAFYLEFKPNNEIGSLSDIYFNSYQIQYKEFFEQMYGVYADLVIDNIKFNEINSEKDILLNLVLNKNYNKIINRVNIDDTNPFGVNSLNDGGSITDFIPDIAGTTLNKDNLLLVYDDFASSKNYLEFGLLPFLSRNISDTIKSADIKPIKLHLYPQEDLYKIGDGKTLITPNGLFDETNRFDGGNLTGGILNGLNITPEVGGVFLKDFSSHSNSIDFIVNDMVRELTTKIKLDLPHFWHLDSNTVKVYNEYLEYFEITHKKIFTDYLVKKLNEYVVENIGVKLELSQKLEKNTVKFGGLLTGLSVVLDGYDVNSDDTKSQFYEVIPNGYELKTTANELFGYNPYYEYRLMSFAENQIIKLNEVLGIVNDRYTSTPNNLKFLSLCNGIYFFKQITKNNDILSLISNDYTFDNNLPESIALTNNIDLSETDPNFIISSDGITINNEVNIDGLSGSIKTSDLNSFDEVYNMKYTFEKINYEFFEFSNKVVDVMLNDNFISSNFDFDLTYNSQLNFKKQLDDFVTFLTFDDWLDSIGEVLTEGTENLLFANYQKYLSGATNLFYNGEKTQLKSIPINYYQFSENPDLTSVSVKDVTIRNINNKIKYNYRVSDKVVRATSDVYRPYIGEEIEMSGLLDLLFINFLTNLNEGDKTEILDLIKAANDAQKGVSGGDKTKQSQKNSRLRKIEKTLNSIFTVIGRYVKEMTPISKDLFNDYKSNYTSVVTNIENVLVRDAFIGPAVDNGIFNRDLIVNRLMKGGVEEYTILIKDTNEILGDTLNNYILFTNTKDLLNISTESSDSEIIEDLSGTEFDRYIKDI